MTYREHGARVAARHSVATITNVSTTPIAYFLRVRSADRGQCPTRGARLHNAMALLPNEKAEAVVCAGKGRIKIEDLRVLEITPLGHAYFSKIPPIAVGHDAVTASAHQPLRKLPLCTKTPSVTISNALRGGVSQWEDVADFYSRHNCERYQFFPGYKLAKEALPELPVLPP